MKEFLRQGFKEHEKGRITFDRRPHEKNKATYKCTLRW